MAQFAAESVAHITAEGLDQFAPERVAHFAAESVAGLLRNMQNCWEVKGSPHNQLVKDSIQSGCKEQQPDWSEAIAVGSQQFIADIHTQLNCKPFGRKILERGDTFILREVSDAYARHLPAKKAHLSANNSYYLPINCVESGG